MLRAVWLLKVTPNHGVAFQFDSTLQWPTADLSTIAAQDVDAIQRLPVTIRYNLTQEIAIERSIIEDLRNDSCVPADLVKMPLAFERCDQACKCGAIDDWNNGVHRWPILPNRLHQERDFGNSTHAMNERSSIPADRLARSIATCAIRTVPLKYAAIKSAIIKSR
jgi:hypothetical protein